jgi:hypothetical protein
VPNRYDCLSRFTVGMPSTTDTPCLPLDNKKAGFNDRGSSSKCGRKWNAVGIRKFDGKRGDDEMFFSIARDSGLRDSNRLPFNMTLLLSPLVEDKPKYCDNMATSSCLARYIDSKYCRRI